jgi:hypothetical protein
MTSATWLKNWYDLLSTPERYLTFGCPDIDASALQRDLTKMARMLIEADRADKLEVILPHGLALRLFATLVDLNNDVEAEMGPLDLFEPDVQPDLFGNREDDQHPSWGGGEVWDSDYDA